MASWSVDPDTISDANYEYPVTIIEFESGLESRNIVRPSIRRGFKCGFNLDKESIILEHFIACKGPLYSFLFIHPETKDRIMVRYKENVLERKKVTQDLYELTVSIIEVFGES
jgi:hypothetical protein